MNLSICIGECLNYLILYSYHTNSCRLGYVLLNLFEQLKHQTNNATQDSNKVHVMNSYIWTLESW